MAAKRRAGPAAVIGIHSFTPVFKGVARPWHAGILYRKSRGFGHALAEALGEDISRRSGMPQKLLSSDAIEWLMQQPWPGNIRELRNTLEQVSLMSDDMQLTAAHFQGGPALRVAAEPLPAAVPAAASHSITTAQAVAPLPELIEALERDAIRRALQATGGNRMAAARLLQISRASLYERLARWPDLEVQVSGNA